MGDISRHRDIYLNTRGALPSTLLERCKLTSGDLTYLELGNYFTDVSQFRDPVVYIFAKQRIWREEILPKVGSHWAVLAFQALTALAALAAAAALAQARKGAAAALPLAALPLQGALANKFNDAVADVLGLDSWIDRMFGKPIERLGPDGRRKSEEYGLVGQFFEHFIEGITHLLFAQEITHQVKGTWKEVDKIPEQEVAAAFAGSFTQYYPHEHTDQPPYVWDASERQRSQHRKWYGPSRRNRGLVDAAGGIMNVVDEHYIRYLAEGLSRLEADWRQFRPDDASSRRKGLLRLGKLLHGVEDWYFHSNLVELIRFRSFAAASEGDAAGEDLVRRFVQRELTQEPAFLNADTARRVGLQRRLYRRLRAPVYLRGTRTNSAGRASTTESTSSVDHAYPAFPSQQDTAHTLLGALENLERKGSQTPSGPPQLPDWWDCVLDKFLKDKPDGRKLLEEKARARGLDVSGDPASWTVPTGSNRELATAVAVDVMREWLPLVVTLLYEDERQRLVANVEPLAWKGKEETPPRRGPTPPGTEEVDAQLDRHKLALKQEAYPDGRQEGNYERAVRYLGECGFLNPLGQSALNRAFEIDRKSQKLNDRAPGAGGFLIKFAVDLQRALDEGDAATERLNARGRIFDQASDNGSFSEIVGSHSLMSKDTLESSPFFDDAKVLASVASQSVCRLFLEQVSAPGDGSGLDWVGILRHLIRFPTASKGWERQAVAFFREQGRIPTHADLPELTGLSAARLPAAAALALRRGTMAADLEQEYFKLERQVSQYRYP